MSKSNIAMELSETELATIADDVLKRADEDLESMKEWIDSVDEGLKLNKPEFLAKSDPWDGAANYKSTLLTEASNNFGNRASVEIMRDFELVKAEIIGLATIQNVIDAKSDEVAEMKETLDQINQQVQEMQQSGEQLPPEIESQLQEVQKEIADREATIKEKKSAIKAKTQRADRVAVFQNWQVNHDMPEWRRDMKRLLYSLPNVGTTFKKSYYDSSKGRCVSDVINFPNFIVNQATVDLKSCRSFTHIIAVNKNGVVERVKSKLWVEPKIQMAAEGSDGDAGSNEKNGVQNAFDNDDCFFEQYCWIDLDDDGYEEPYIVTLHKMSGSVVRIVARFDYSGLIVKYKDMRPMPILEAQRARAAALTKEAEEFGTQPEIPDAEDLTGFRVVRIEPKGVISKYGFIPSHDGSFLDVGFFHLIGAMTLGDNKITNDLLNSGTLATQQCGISAKGFRKRQGDFKFKMGSIMSTEIPAEQLQNSIYMLQFKEPSITLFNLRESIRQSASSFAANVDVGGQITANTAPTTALAMIQESLTQHTAHIGLFIDSMGDEFKIFFELNGDYLTDEDYQKVVGDDEASYEEDFATDGLSVVCGANPEMSSRTQRMMLADAELAQVPLVMQAGGNAIPIIKNYFKRIGSENIQEIFPNEAEMSAADKQQMQQMKAAQEQANKLQEQQNKIQELQVALLGRAEDRKDAELELAKPKTMAEVDQKLQEVEKIKGETEKLNAETKLLLERTDSEAVNRELAMHKARSEHLSTLEAVEPVADTSHIEAAQIKAESDKELKLIEIAGHLVASKNDNTAQKEQDVHTAMSSQMQAIKELAASLAKPKNAQIKIEKTANGFVGTRVEE
jgi:hypothetical protein